jgi:hypothetical protein
MAGLPAALLKLRGRRKNRLRKMHNTFRLRQSHLAEMFRNWNLENEMFE